MQYTLNKTQQTVNLPTYNVFSGQATIPYNNSTGGTLTIAASQNNFDGAPTTTTSEAAYAARTKDLYATLTFGQMTMLYNEAEDTNFINVPYSITEVSPCIVSTGTYYVDTFVMGMFQSEATLSVQPSSDASGDYEVMGSFVAPMNPALANVAEDVVISH